MRTESIQPCRRSRYTLAWCALGILVVGAIYRVALGVVIPVGYDEIFDWSLGLIDMRKSWAAFLFEVPVEHSTTLAPLWWWAQLVPTQLAGDVSLTALRVLPIACGVAGLVVGYFVARRTQGRRRACIFMALLAASDVAAFHVCKGEFHDPLLLLFLLPCVCRVGKPDRGFVRGLLWSGLALTHLGKGLWLMLLDVAAEAVVILLDPRRRARRVASLAVSGTFVAAAVAGWLTLVQGHYADRSIPHAVGRAENVLSLLKAVTLDYSQAKAHMTGTVRDALQPFLDGRVWPLTALTAPWLAVTALGTCVEIIARRRRRGRLSSGRIRVLGLLTWAVLGFGLVAGRGMLGARFHLAYLPAAWLLTARSVGAVRHWSYPRVGVVLAAMVLWFSVALGWGDWAGVAFNAPRIGLVAGVGGIAGGSLLLVLRLVRVPASRAIWCIGLAAAAGSMSALGPIAWARATANDSDPMPLPTVGVDRTIRSPLADPSVPATGSLHVYLANYFLSQQDLPSAEHYARLATTRTPDDGLAWFYLGLVYDTQGRPQTQRRAVWSRAVELNPGSAQAAQRLRDASE